MYPIRVCVCNLETWEVYVAARNVFSRAKIICILNLNNCPVQKIRVQFPPHQTAFFFLNNNLSIICSFTSDQCVFCKGDASAPCSRNKNSLKVKVSGRPGLAEGPVVQRQLPLGKPITLDRIFLPPGCCCQDGLARPHAPAPPGVRLLRSASARWVKRQEKDLTWKSLPSVASCSLRPSHRPSIPPSDAKYLRTRTHGCLGPLPQGWVPGKPFFFFPNCGCLTCVMGSPRSLLKCDASTLLLLEDSDDWGFKDLQAWNPCLKQTTS